MTSLVRIVLKPGRDRSVRNRHPWIFSGAVAAAEGGPGPCRVCDAGGEPLAAGYFNPDAELCVRLYAWAPETEVSDELWRHRLAGAVAMREAHLRARPEPETNAFRLVFSEADGMSGLMVDRYDDALSIRISARAAAHALPALLEPLAALPGVRRLHAAWEPEAARREGVDPGVPTGWPVLPAEVLVAIREHGARFEVSPAGGQKTGFFLDQRDNRARVAALAAGARVLGAYCYTGAFEIQAARAGAAQVTAIDSSAPALEQLRRHAEINGVADRIEPLRADVPVALRSFRDAGRTFDGIILDPPRFVFSAAQKEKGLRAYKDINLLAMKLLAPGGWLATFSCSGLVSEGDFRSMLRWAAVDTRRTVRLVELCGQPFDHPISATVPESAYLKGWICRVD